MLKGKLFGFVWVVINPSFESPKGKPYSTEHQFSIHLERQYMRWFKALPSLLLINVAGNLSGGDINFLMITLFG